MASFVLSFFPLDVLDEIWDLIESVSEGFLTYSFSSKRQISIVNWHQAKQKEEKIRNTEDTSISNEGTLLKTTFQATTRKATL